MKTLTKYLSENKYNMFFVTIDADYEDSFCWYNLKDFAKHNYKDIKKGVIIRVHTALVIAGFPSLKRLVDDHMEVNEYLIDESYPSKFQDIIKKIEALDKEIERDYNNKNIAIAYEHGEELLLDHDARKELFKWIDLYKKADLFEVRDDGYYYNGGLLDSEVYSKYECETDLLFIEELIDSFDEDEKNNYLDTSKGLFEKLESINKAFVAAGGTLEIAKVIKERN